MRDEDGGEVAFDAALAGALVGDAICTLAVASGEEAADTAAARAIVRAASGQVVERLAGPAGRR